MRKLYLHVKKLDISNINVKTHLFKEMVEKDEILGTLGRHNPITVLWWTHISILTDGVVTKLI